MIARTIGAIALSAAAIAASPQESAPRASAANASPRIEVRVTGEGADERLDVSIAGRPAPIGAVLRAIALESRRDLVGLDLLGREPDVMAYLDGAPLRDGLRWIGGSVGLNITLNAERIDVREDLPPYPTQRQLFDRAAAGYFRALVDHPDSDHAPKAAWNRAEIMATLSGRALETAELFDDVVADYPASDLVPSALLAAGRAFGRAGAWEDAAARFDQLAGLPYAHEHQWTARRLLADAHTRIAEQATNPVVARENATRALHILDWLDDEDPHPDGDTRLERAKVRSRAHSLSGDPIRALKSLDIAARYSPRGQDDADLAELRAHAMERAGRGADAVRGWLRYGDLAGGDERARAYGHAADVANAHDEHLTAIAIAQAARKAGFGAAVAGAEAHAWAALDMEPLRTDLFGDPERLERAEMLIADGHPRQAADALRPVYERRGGLTETEAKRLALAYGAALAAIGRMDEAMLALRRLVETQRQVEDRRDLYLLAARLLEEDGQLERAIEALEGKL